jgi:hypothetical protein
MVLQKLTTEEKFANKILDNFVGDVQLNSLPPIITPKDLYFMTEYYYQLEEYFPSGVKNIDNVESEISKKYSIIREHIIRDIGGNPNSFSRLLKHYDFNMDTRDNEFKQDLESSYSTIKDLRKRKRKEVHIPCPMGEPAIEELSLNSSTSILKYFMNVAPTLLRIKIRGNVGEALRIGSHPEENIPLFFKEYLCNSEMYRLYDPVGEESGSEDYFINLIKDHNEGLEVDVIASTTKRYFMSKFQSELVRKIYETD